MQFPTTLNLLWVHNDARRLRHTDRVSVQYRSRRIGYRASGRSTGVQHFRRIDQRDVGKRLGKVPRKLALNRIILFRQQPHMISLTDQFLEELLRLKPTSTACEILDHPE